MPIYLAVLVFLFSIVLLSAVLRRPNQQRKRLFSRLEPFVEAAAVTTPAEVRRPVKVDWRWIGRRAPKRLVERYEQMLKRTGLPIKGEEMAAAYVLSVIAGLLLGTALFSWLGGLLGLAVGAAIPDQLLRRHQQRRRQQFEEQLVDFMSLIANALRSGHSLLQAFELASREMTEPMSDEVKHLLHQSRLGIPLEDALSAMVERIDSQEMEFMVTAVLVQRQVGGDLAIILDHMSDTIRQRQRVKGEVRAATAQGRISGLVISLLPVLLILLINATNPGYMQPMFSHPLGIAMLVCGASSMLIGTMIIRRIVRVDF